MIRIASILCALALIAGCKSENQGNGGGPSVHALIESYMDHAQKEVDTRTAATGEHAMHEDEMRNIEKELQERCKTEEGRKSVGDHLNKHINDVKNQVKEIESRRNSLRVVGRELTPEESAWVGTGADEEIRHRRWAIGVLEKLLTRVGL